MRNRWLPALVCVIVAALMALSPNTVLDAEDSWQRDIAIYWSPFIYQGTHNNYDIPTNWDFDGNMSGEDNWEQAFTYINQFRAYVYYTFQESDSHYFLTYLFFHPRDTKQLAPHENDWEGARVTVAKDGSAWGAFEKLETFSHGGFHQTTAPTWVNIQHPAVWVEARGHGVEVFNDGIFPNDCGGLGLGYHYGVGAEIPDHCNDRSVGYDLIPFEDTLWPLRFGFSGPFAETATYNNGAYYGRVFRDDDGCHAKPPWGWTFLGYWFLSPLPANFYVYNPFSADTSSGSVGDCP